jgi:hypothetical protein
MVVAPISVRHTLAVLALAWVELARATAIGAQGLGRHYLAGACYDLSVGSWRPAPLRGADTIYIAPPSRVRFDTVRAERSSDRFAMTTAPGALPSVHRFAIWWPVGGDSVGLIWSTGFSGLRMKLGGQPDELRGEAEAFWDFPRDPLTAEVTARRVSCDAPPHPSVTAQRFVFRAVPLASGDSVPIGVPFISIRAIADSVRGRLFRMRHAPAAPFSGATAVEVSVNTRDTVWRVEVAYPPGTDFESLVARFATELGPPVSRSTLPNQPAPAVSSEWITWANRTTRLTLYHSVSTGGEPRITVVLTDHRLRP